MGNFALVAGHDAHRGRFADDAEVRKADRAVERPDHLGDPDAARLLVVGKGQLERLRERAARGFGHRPDGGGGEALHV